MTFGRFWVSISIVYWNDKIFESWLNDTRVGVTNMAQPGHKKQTKILKEKVLIVFEPILNLECSIWFYIFKSNIYASMRYPENDVCDSPLIALLSDWFICRTHTSSPEKK